MAISRRQFMTAAAATAMSPFASRLLATSSQPLDGSDGIGQASATELARAINRGVLSSEEVVRVYLQRIDALNGSLNAIVQLDPEGAIAAGMSALDVGSDTGASVRYPAHCCGIAGLKPTHGRVPRTGHIVSFAGITESLTTLGPLARRVEDLELILRIIAGPDSYDPHIAPAPLGDAAEVGLKGLRAAVFTQVGDVTASQATMTAIDSASDFLRDAGVSIELTSPPRMTEAIDLFFGMFAGDGGQGLKGFLDMLGTTEPSAQVSSVLRMLNQNTMSTAQFHDLVLGLDMWRSDLLAFMERYDVLICPVCAHPAPKSLTTFETREDVLPPELFAYTAPFNLTGWPVAVVRVGQAVGGLPIGAQIVTKPWREDLALAVAAHLEKSLGGYLPPEL